MDTPTVSIKSAATNTRHLARRLLIIGENRLELLAVEVQEERERLVRAVLLALGLAAFGLLAGIALTAAIVVWSWNWSPVAALLMLSGLYAGIGAFFYQRLSRLLSGWHTLQATLEQLRKDWAGLEKTLS